VQIRRFSHVTFILSVLTACGGLVEDAPLDRSNVGSGGEVPSTTGEPDESASLAPGEPSAVAPGSQEPSTVVPMPLSMCDPNKPFVIEDLGIEGRAPSVSRDETVLVYEHEQDFYERTRTPTTAFGAGTVFFPKYSKYALDAVIAPDGLGLDYVYIGLPEVEGTAGRSVRASKSVPFAPGTTPPVPDPTVPVWRVANIGGTTYYTSGWDEKIHVVRGGVHSVAVPKAFRWFAVSENELLIHYAPLDGGLDRRVVARRKSKSDPFGSPTELPELTPGKSWAPLFVTWASSDDCVVYGWSYYFGNPNGDQKLGIFRAHRG
jgi:hypothetical protein